MNRELTLELDNRLIEHAPMRRGRRTRELAADAAERQLRRLPLRRLVTLGGRERPADAARGRSAVRFGLLILDVFALEAPRHR